MSHECRISINFAGANDWRLEELPGLSVTSQKTRLCSPPCLCVCVCDLYPPFPPYCTQPTTTTTTTTLTHNTLSCLASLMPTLGRRLQSRAYSNMPKRLWMPKWPMVPFFRRCHNIFLLLHRITVPTTPTTTTPKPTTTVLPPMWCNTILYQRTNERTNQLLH